MSAALRIIGLSAVVGVLSIGIGSRLVMLLLARLNPAVDGVISDDGFEMGRFTLAGSLNLVVAGLALGLVSGVLYLLLEPLLVGPEWFRTVSLSLGAGAVGAANLVHADGVDFTLIQPLWLTVGLCTALPVAHVAAVHLAARGVRSRTGTSAPSVHDLPAWLLRGGLTVLFVLAVASLVADVDALSG